MSRRAAIQSVLTHPVTLAVVAYLPFLLVPSIDLTVSSWFYTPGQGFSSGPFYEFVRKDLPYFMFGPLTAVAVLGVMGELVGKRVLGVTRRLVAYLVLSLALGPGLLVNTVFKDNWGRARPSTITEFGGQKLFTLPLELSDQCIKNCSFSSGHGALGFWAVAVALLVPGRWRAVAITLALAFGCMVGFVRIAQGGHFLSDVVFSAYVTIGVALLLHRWLMRPAPERAPISEPLPPG